MGSVIRRETLSSVPAFSFEDLGRRAQEIIARAEAQARKIVADADVRARQAEAQQRAAHEARCRQAHQDAAEQGRREGTEQALRAARAEALTAARDELTQAIHALQAGLAEFELEKRGVLALAESGLLELALAIARRVCKIQITSSAESACANARALLQMVGRHDDLQLRMNPDDVELLGDVADGFGQHVAELEHVTIQPDPAVERGGCLLRTREGVIDASISAQLDRIAEAICGRQHAGPAGADAGPAEPGTTP